MCEYCGCQDIPQIAELIDEHDRLRDLGAQLTAAARRDDLLSASRLAQRMLDVLAPHTEVEERALFPAMAGDFGPYVSHLVDEHHAIEAVLRGLAEAGGAQGPGNWPAAARSAVGQLFKHILKEQDGVFPAALATLGSADWDALTDARAAADRARQCPPAGASLTSRTPGAA